MLREWHDFYILLGTASATLVALLFVAVSIGVGLLSAERSTATRTYMSPIILHYASVLFISLITLVPTLGDGTLALLVGLSGTVGFVYSGTVCFQLIRDRRKVEFVDHFGYGLWPLLGYCGIVLAAYWMVAHREWGPDDLAASLLLLLLVNIRNAWDLAVTLARRQADAHRSGASVNQPPSP